MWVFIVASIVVFAVLGIAIVFIVGAFAHVSELKAHEYTATGVDDVVVMIHEGDTGKDVAQSLADHDVTKSFETFYNLLLAEPESPVFQPGTYQLKTKMSAVAALEALLDPATRLDNTVIIPEGTTTAGVYQLLSEGTDIPVEDYQAVGNDVASFGLPPEAKTLEGFLFPERYTFAPEATPREILQTLVNRQFDELDAYGVPAEGRWRTIVLASVIEREAGLRDDFYRVSRVFVNRISQGWKLESDATITYGTGATHRATTTDAERRDANNPYNTYVHPGLPVGPISNPGSLAIDAALHPAEGSWMFFVTWNLDTGETIFSSTLQEHQTAVNKWLIWLKDHPEYG
jgi:UPF0755 protein